MGVFHVFKIVQTLPNRAKHYVIFLRATHNLVIQIMFVEVVGQKRQIFLNIFFINHKNQQFNEILNYLEK